MKRHFAVLTCVAAFSGVAFAEFSECKFNFGRMWSNSFNANTSFAGQGLSHLAIWLGDNANYNQYWEGDMVKAAAKNNLTPVIYAYVIAEYGKDNGLKDCDVGTPNHCTGGANIIRNNWSAILSRYSSYAQGIANDYGTSKPTIWLIEPDFLQYSVTGDQLNTKYAQDGGGIPDADLCGRYFNEIVSTIKRYLPNAKIAVDISPWMNDKITAWYNLFDKSKIDYAFTSGGRTQGNAARIRSDNNNLVTWAQVSQALGGKKIIADDGYGVGGASNSDYQDWMSTSNIASRISDGVIGITIQEPNSAYTSFAAQNSNISIPCGGNPPVSSVISSSSRPSSSSVAPPQSSSSRPSSSSVTPPQSSSSRPSSSSSSRPASSSSATPPAGTWSATNASLNNPTASGVGIGSGSDWSGERVVTRNLGSVQAGSQYTLKFDGDVSRGGQDLPVQISLGSYCNETKTFVGSTVTSYSCSFTANASGNVTLKLVIPGSRWETLTISNLSFTGPGAGVPVLFREPSLTQILPIRLRSGRTLAWHIPREAVIQVIAVSGRSALSARPGQILDLSDAPAGLYIARIRSSQAIETRHLINP